MAKLDHLNCNVIHERSGEQPPVDTPIPNRLAHGSREQKVEKLSARHDLASFQCASDGLNSWFKSFAGTQGFNQGCYVLSPDGAKVAGFYTLTNSLIRMRDLREEDQKVHRMNLASGIGAVIIEHLAAHADLEGREVEQFLLWDAVGRIAKVHTVSACPYAVLDTRSCIEWDWASHGFKVSPSNGEYVYLPIRSFLKTLESPRRPELASAEVVPLVALS